MPPIAADGAEVPEELLDYLIGLHEVAHLAPFPETNAWLELVEERHRDATEGELEVEEESLCWLWAIENSSIPVPEQVLGRVLESLTAYEEEVGLEEGPGWRSGPARRALKVATGPKEAGAAFQSWPVSQAPAVSIAATNTQIEDPGS
jgi:hypothetical protein